MFAFRVVLNFEAHQRYTFSSNQFVEINFKCGNFHPKILSKKKSIATQKILGENESLPFHFNQVAISVIFIRFSFPIFFPFRFLALSRIPYEVSERVFLVFLLFFSKISNTSWIFFTVRWSFECEKRSTRN